MRDRVTPELREAVLRRDGGCVLSKFDAAHECFDMWHRWHRTDDLDRLTIEHVKEHLRMSRRAPSDPQHCVALCGYRNVIRPPTKVERAWMREYLRTAPEPDCGHADPVFGCSACEGRRVSA